jgi:F0F1-type ATP synthase assembly protein I
MENNKKENTIADYLFIGCMFLGIAIGQLLDEPGVGIMGGMGIGFILTAVCNTERNK